MCFIKRRRNLLKIALAGNPNCGKTMLFNRLTGSNQYVGNWPGVTVEKKEGKIKDCEEILLCDLPGVYSLSPYTPEEVVTRDYLMKERPDCVINVVDATNIERNLYLTTQILETGIATVIALNFMDVVEKEGIRIDAFKMSEKLGCRVVEISALKKDGLNELVKAASEEARRKTNCEPLSVFRKETGRAIGEIEDILCENKNIAQSLYYAVKIFERDKLTEEFCELTAYQKKRIEDIISERERAEEDDSESIIINARYEYITDNLRDFAIKPGDKLTLTEKIDRVVTNKYAAIPIFLLIMAAMYFISITLLGGITENLMTAAFDKLGSFAKNELEALNAAPFLTGLLTDGIIAGVGAVLVFVPQLIILFLFLSFLEDCGYMARVAFILDRLMRKFGMSGKSFIPLLVSSGCGVSGVMATRTIENDKDRRMTVMLATFIPCGAKIPIITVFSSAVIGRYFAPIAYLVCVFAVFFWGFILKRTKFFKGEENPFVMELPSYRWPGFKMILKHTYERSKAFVVKAGTVILLACVVVWALYSFTPTFKYIPTDENLTVRDSMLYYVGSALSYIFIPLGFGKGNWQAAVATFSGFIAKENVVGTLGVMLSSSSDAMFNDSLRAMFSLPSALSFVFFSLLAAPCVAAMSAIRREMKSAKWTAAALLFQTGTAYLTSFLIYHIGSLFSGKVGTGSIIASAIIAVLLFAAIFFTVKNSKKKGCGYCANCPECFSDCKKNSVKNNIRLKKNKK